MTLRARRARTGTVFTVLVALLTYGVGTATAADPIVAVGPVGSPAGGATAAGTTNQNGQSDACVNDQHSGVNPGASTSTGVVALADGPCAPSGATASGGGNAPSGGGAAGAGAGGTQAAGAGQPAETGGSRQTSTSHTTNGAPLSYRISVAHASARQRTTTRTMASVAAASASGLKITAIRYQLLRTKTGKRLRVVVNLRDRKRRAVRFGVVSITGPARVKGTGTGLRLSFSNRIGQASFVVPLTTAMLGRHIRIRVDARTPAAHAVARRSVLVPKKPPRSSTPL